MVEPSAFPTLPSPQAPVESSTQPVAGDGDDKRAERARQARAAIVVIAALAVLGAVLGTIWQAWSPPGPAGIKLAGGIQADETEAFVAGDGRFALIAVVVGLLAGAAAWYVPLLRRARGPYLAAALAVGGVGGAALTELIGYLLRGSGPDYTCGDGSYTCVQHLPLTVHMHALLLFEAVAAVLVYLLFVAFAAADDLGRPDPGRVVRAPAAFADSQLVAPAQSVGTQGDSQQGGRHSDASGGS